MNWLIWEKMFTCCFYNKFRPVNCMLYIKCGGNRLLHNSGCCRRSVILGSLFCHNTQYLQLAWFTLVWYSTKRGTMHKPTSLLVHLYTVPFLWPWEEHRRQHSWVDDFAGQRLLWRLSSRTTFVAPALVLPTSLGVGRSLLFRASSIKFLTRRSLMSWWVYLAPHEDKSIQLLSTVRSGMWKKISWSTRRYVYSSNSCWPYNQNCQRNSCAGCTVPWCEVSRGCYCCHKNFLLLVVGLY
jgi:hypothetical protein